MQQAHIINWKNTSLADKLIIFSNWSIINFVFYTFYRVVLDQIKVCLFMEKLPNLRILFSIDPLSWEVCIR